MDVILLERVEKLGQMGDVVDVKPGYARNFLLPRGKALRANKANRQRFENERAQLEARNLELRTEAEAVQVKLDGESVTVIRQASESGQLYGSVATRDIAEGLTEGGFSVERQQVVLQRPIKVLGLHDVTVRLHPEVTATVTVNVARTQDEAERQARGEDVTVDRTDEEEEAALLAEEVFEDAEQAAALEAGDEEAGEEASSDKDETQS
ncbi:LSU ribosomal protein L9p [Candidatus Phaeomarinobacter ectocarpi]|uniref:Large ribosomal subunit protein bL9 n=1 Tax=Candidatus Phaeomarinibacter ectocarpi TaxID=1458461 RepID=X5MP38_9HYPH|nr:50S ribosomal protein L9 [Candidatus Phaeomarinobacter ectocarpi]CDO60866.1 LSU ribosomal protein L9p [Candidatus Phaeomarinobacter ectocarpi]